jgi:hypothetical protein
VSPGLHRPIANGLSVVWWDPAPKSSRTCSCQSQLLLSAPESSFTRVGLTLPRSRQRKRAKPAEIGRLEWMLVRPHSALTNFSRIGFIASIFSLLSSEA